MANSSSLLLSKTPLHFSSISQPTTLFPSTISTLFLTSNALKFPSLRLYSTHPGGTNTPSDKPDDISTPGIVDEWGERAEPEPPLDSSIADPPIDDDEWGRDNEVVTGSGNGSAGVSEIGAEKDNYGDRIGDLKRCLVDTVYGMNLGLDASLEVRAEVMELVNQLEAVNPTPAPTEATELLDGNWVLVYTAFSELLPLLAVGKVPLLKVEKICQSIDTSSLNIDNSVTISTPFATISFSASASFEVRSPSRIQVEFKEGTLKPLEINSSIDLPQNIDVFGQTINLAPVQQSLNPLQDIVANISRVISGQPPLKVPIPGDRSNSWLLTTFLDGDLRISRGDGGLFVLAKEGSPLLDQ